MSQQGPRRKGRRFVALATTVAALAVLFPLAPAAQAGPTHYVVTSDGIEIALNIRKPDNFVKGRAYPTVFEMSGYDGGSADGADPTGGEGSRYLTKPFHKDYFTIHASVRGTGCSGGEFDLFSWRSALDGYEVIEWINDQQWSNGEIAIYGHSYGGITGTMIAATRPPSLDAVTVSGLIDDLFRGIVYPGGVSNYGFPLLWTGAIRPVYDVGGGTYPGLVEHQDANCGKNLTSRSRTVLNDPLVQGLQDTDNEWFRARSLISYIDRIEVPVHITAAFNDEQTGPRGPYNLFEHLSRDIPRRMVQSNGNHGTQTDAFNQRDRKSWVDHWLGVDRSPSEFGSWPHGAAHSSVLTRFENLTGDKDDARGYNKESRTWPLEDTDWTDVYLHSDGSIDRRAPKKEEDSLSYFSGSLRQSWSYQAGHTPGSPLTTADGPDELTFTSAKFDRPTAIAGPLSATLFVSSSAPDTELFVQLIDEAPDGTRYHITRGLLKASHRAINRHLSDKVRSGSHAGEIYRPYRPHTNPILITPGEVTKYLVEVFPVGHVFRPGHRLIVKVHAPPIVDSYYIYIPKRVPGVNTLHFGPDAPSRLMVPFVPIEASKLGPKPEPCSLEAVRCIPG